MRNIRLIIDDHLNPEASVNKLKVTYPILRRTTLEITAKLNDKINVVPIALFNKAVYSEIEIDGNNLGGSSIILHRQNSTRETIPTITLDEWAKQNNIPRVDFIF